MKLIKKSLLTTFQIAGVLSLLTVCLAGCGTNSTTNHTSSNSAMSSMNMANMTQPMAKVKMTIPKTTSVHHKVEFSVLVTQHGKPLNQVQDVMFEIWNTKPNAKHQLTHAHRTGDGIFSITYSFATPGTYDVMYHVVAQGNMIMTGPQMMKVTK